MGSHSLPALPWPKDGLKPHISPDTIDFHYGKHHQAYVNRLNELAQADKNLTKPVDELIKPGATSGVAFNQAAQIWNHTFYWNSLAPNAGGAPQGAIADKIKADFGSFDDFKTQFTAACTGHFGSGWIWLVLGKDGKLKIHQTHDAGNPITEDAGTPILTCDVWEHAYYIDQRNARPQYIAAWWNLVNWNFANQNLGKTSKL